MTRYAIDAQVAIRLVRKGITVPEPHQLVAPKSLQTHAMSHLYREVRAGRLETDAAREILDAITTMRIRLLGDRVSRGRAWRIAEQLGWDEIGDAEYVAVATLQADAFITLDPKLAQQVRELVTLASVEDLVP